VKNQNKTLNMACNSFDEDGVVSEAIRHRRQERGGIKAALTKKIRQITDFMNSENPEAVEKTFTDVKYTMNNLWIKHDELVELAVNNKEEIIEAERYMREVTSEYDKLKHQVTLWLDSQMGKICDGEVGPDDSASQTGRSEASNTSSMLKLRAKKAALLAKSAMLEKQQELKRQQTELELAQEKLALKSEIEATDAEEKVYEEAESSQTNVLKISRGLQLPDSGEASDERHTVRQSDPKRTGLNPAAKPWAGAMRTGIGNVHRNAGIHVRNVDRDNPANLNSVQSSALLMQQKMLDVVQLPKSELIKFDGDPLRYWVFIRSFEVNVAESSVSSGAKLNRLLNYCTGKALGVIECCAVMDPDDGYREALSLLKSRFGSQHVISNAWVKKITEGPWLRPGDVDGLRQYADDLRSAIMTLKAMGKVNEVDNQMRMVKIVARLPAYLQGRWRTKAVQSLVARGEYPNIEELVSFIMRAAEEVNDPVFGVISASKEKDESSQNRSKPGEKKGVSYSVQTSDNDRRTSTPENPSFPKSSCPLCSGEHALFMCGKFKDMKPEKRYEFVQHKRLCFNCFMSNHRSRDCRKPSKCQVQGCTRKHSRLIHLLVKPEGNSQQTYPKEKSSGSPSILPSQDKPLQAESSACDVSTSETVRVALPVVRVQVTAKKSRRKLWTYALLDYGSTNSFCSDKLLDDLGVDGVETTLVLTTLEKVNSKTSTRVTSLLITGEDERSTVEIPYVFSTSNLSGSGCEPVSQQKVEDWPHLKGINFPKVDRVNVGLIIGQDVPVALTPIDVRRGEENEPYAMKTALGWVLNGPMRDFGNGEISSHFVHVDQRLDALVERFWKMERCESLADDQCEMSREDKRTIKIWDDSAKVVEGHYELNIPFKTKPPRLDNNYSVAEHRFQSLSRRLSSNDKLCEKYKAGISELIEKGYAEKVKDEDINIPGEGVWYIPHHAVVNENKPDKVRIVFDCAAKFCGTSLNDEVYQGPDLTNKLMGVLLRFREGPIGVMGDIDGMFHQVKVPECDRDYLRFLWFADDDQKQPAVYRMTVHLFGGVWSPSCASYALRRTAEDNIGLFESEVIQTVVNDFYVDDCLKSLKTETEAVSLVRNLCELVNRGGFQLNKWISNNRTVLQSIPNERRAKVVKEVDIVGGELPTDRALGVLWDTEHDEFGFRIKIKTRPSTRRGLLSILSSVYDPLGLVSPVILQAKKILQTASKSGKGWDDALSQTTADEWARWLNDLQKLEQCRFPRCVINPDFGETTYELHHFSDASSEGYGSVSYLRMVNGSGGSHCVLLTSKSRLAPVKQMTIPRLELSAAVVSVKLDVMLRREMTLKISRSVFWTDSMIVIHYIRNESKRFQVFVANRIALIHESSEPEQWRHVDSANNPADDVSRGLSASEMVSSDRWKHGPKYLSDTEDKWPEMPTECSELTDDDKEVKKDAKSYTVTSSVQSDPIDDLFQRYSSWYRLKRGVAWLLRLKRILYDRNHKKSQSVTYGSTLSVSEINSASVEILKILQRKKYEQEFKALELGKPIARRSPIYRLEPVLSSSGVLCVGGRLGAAPVSEEIKHQMILPRDSHVTNLIIRHNHELSGHSGKEYVLSLIRQKFWIPRGRKIVSKFLSVCVYCNKQRNPGVQRMADLPSDRVKPGDPPFSSVGLDCFGPFMVKRGRSEVKRYGCIFTCLTTRAIHLEKLDGLDTDSFLNGFVRFISRRGCPKRVRSDNGTNFHGAEAELRRAIEAWNLKQIEHFMSRKEICWVFNPPAASHMGGVWERLIRTVRKVMNAVMNAPTRPLDDDGLATLFCEVESIVNSRPITVVSDHLRDAEALTPNHLLLLRAGHDLPLGGYQVADSYRKRWKYVQFQADIFWKRWLKEYLPELQLRQKWVQPKRNIIVGDVVLVVNETSPRRSWPLGRILETYPGKDGLVRTVLVRTGTTTLTRPIDKLCLLEGVMND